MNIVCRPLVSWPGTLRSDEERRYHRFRVGWDDTLAMLREEAEQLGATEIVLQLAVDDLDLRRDGWPRANTKTKHPGVTVVLPDSDRGRVSWSTDLYLPRWYGDLDGWQANVRAIALSMEALRAVDRHGVAQGAQYAGFRELGAGLAMPATQMTVEDAARFLAEHGGPWADPGPTSRMVEDLAAGALREPAALTGLYRIAVKRLHPDAGGDPDLFRQLQDVKRLLDQHGGAA